PAQRVAKMPDGLRAVQIGLQVQPEVALKHDADLRRGEVRREMLSPAAGVDPPGRWLLDLADVEEQHVHRVQLGNRRGEVAVRDLGRWPRSGCAGIELAQR